MANKAKVEAKLHGHPGFYKILEEIKGLHSRKNTDYATNDKPLGNFQRVADWCVKYKLITPGQEAFKVAMIFKLKQLDAALKLVSENQVGGVESVPERLRDDGTYSFIAELLYKEGAKDNG